MAPAPLLAAVLERSTGADSRVHGLDHWRRVARIGHDLASTTDDVDLDVVDAFAVLHDAMRQNDADDPGHGARGAALAADLRASGILDMGDVAFGKLVRACRDHTNGTTSGDPTIGACWDADRLDLGRVGVRPAAAFLSTEAARARTRGARVVTEVRPVGWRVWRLVIRDGEARLASPERGDVWEPRRPFVAVCKYGGDLHAVPGANCSCGVYVSANVRDAIDGVYGATMPGFVAGKVRLSGRVVASGHAEGEWRGERATIEALYVKAGSVGVASMLADAYGVPVETVLGDLRTLGRASLSGVDLDVLYEIRGWKKRRDGLGRLVPPEFAGIRV